MKLLFVANRVPYPPFRGDKLKIYNLASRLKNSHELHLITIAESREDLTYKAELEKIFKTVEFIYLPKWKSLLNVALGFFKPEPLQVSYFRSNAFSRLLDNKLEKGQFDAVHVQHLRMGAFFEKRSTVHAVLDLPDAFSLYWLRRKENASNFFQKWFAGREYKKLLAFEKKLLPHFKLNLVCSEEDKAYLRENARANIEVLPNGVDTGIFYPRADIKPEVGRILFTGNMDYAPNVDAVEYFCTEIFPEILKNVPNARFVIAGQRPVQRVLSLAGPNVEVTGFVKNLADEYARATVLAAPLRFGAGTQNKVLEALAMGLPVVCTKVGFKGLGIKSGAGAVLATETDEFASVVSKILLNPELRASISLAGGDTIARKFSWDAVSTSLEAYLQSMAKK